MAKRGLSDIVTTVLIILLVITAVAIIWVFVQNFIFSSSSQLDISTFSEHISIVPQSLVIDKSGSSTTKVAFLVKRNAGQSDLTGLHVIIEDKSGKSVVQRVDVSLKEFETKKVDLVVSGISQVNKVSIIPIFLKEGEKEGEGLQYSYSAETASVWNNLLDSSTWIVGSSGSQPGFSKNGLDIENVIELGEGPDGRERVLWKAINQDPDSVIEPSRPDGGWVTSKFNIDKSKTYRFSVWIKKTGSNTGTTYLGAYGSDNNLNYLDGTTITNPIFFMGIFPP